MREKITYANVVATLALVIAVGTGGAWAATQLSGKLLQNRSTPGKKLKKNTVTGKEVKEAKLAKVPKARNADLAANAARLGGKLATGFVEGSGTVLSGHDTGSAGGPPGPSDTLKSIATPLGDFSLECSSTSTIVRYRNSKPGNADVFRSVQATTGAASGSVDYFSVPMSGDVNYAVDNSQSPFFLDLRAGKDQESVILRAGLHRSGSDCVWDWEFVGSS